MSRTLTTLACGCALALLAIALPARAQTRPAAQTLVQDVKLEQNLDAQVPLDLKFVDEGGRTVELSEYFKDGKPVILSLVYFRCPMLCTQVLNGLVSASQSMPLEMQRDYHVISVSIDPRETPEMAAAKKKSYLHRYRRPGGEGGWHFLTGDQQAIEKLADTVGFRFEYDPQSDQYAHASGIMVLTPQGRVSRYLYGIDYHPTDLRLSLVESAENRIGSPVDEFLLMCFHYDPLTGRYGLAISRLLKLAGVGTTLCLGGFLWVMFRKERQRSREFQEHGVLDPAAPQDASPSTSELA